MLFLHIESPDVEGSFLIGVSSDTGGGIVLISWLLVGGSGCTAIDISVCSVCWR